MSTGPSTAWVLATMAIAHVTGNTPLPREVVSAKAGHWQLTLNNSDGHVDEHEGYPLGRFEVHCASDEYLAFGVFGPSGGLIGGYSEDRFIDDLKAVVPEAVWGPVLA